MKGMAFLLLCCILFSTHALPVPHSTSEGTKEVRTRATGLLRVISRAPYLTAKKRESCKSLRRDSTDMCLRAKRQHRIRYRLYVCRISCSPPTTSAPSSSPKGSSSRQRSPLWLRRRKVANLLRRRTRGGRRSLRITSPPTTQSPALLADEPLTTTSTTTPVPVVLEFPTLMRRRSSSPRRPIPIRRRTTPPPPLLPFVISAVLFPDSPFSNPLDALYGPDGRLLDPFLRPRHST